MVKTQNWNSGKEIKSTTLILCEYNNIKTYKLNDIMLLCSGGKRSSLENLAITYSKQWPCKQIFTKNHVAINDEDAANHSIFLNKK